MPLYAYKAKDQRKNFVSGQLEAESKTGALDLLAKQGVFPIQIEEAKAASQTGAFRRIKRIRSLDVSLFARQLADLVESGVPLLEALKLLEDQVENRSLAAVVKQVHEEVSGGRSLSEAMALSPHIFSPVFVSLVLAGEVSGSTSRVLKKLADFAESQDELRSKIFSAMAYPLLIAFVGGGTVLFLTTFVVPRLSEMFVDFGQNLPLVTQALLAISSLSTRFWPVLIVFAVALGIAGRLLFQQDKFRLAADRFIFRLPLWGSLVKKIAVARFARTLSMLLSGGVTIVEALRVVSKTLGHPVLEESLNKVRVSVQGGESLAESLSQMSDFPAFIRNMIAVGEEGNILEDSLEKVASTYERQADRAVKLMTSLLEPAMILLVGSLVGIIVVAMLLPIFQIHTFVR